MSICHVPQNSVIMAVCFRDRVRLPERKWLGSPVVYLSNDCLPASGAEPHSGEGGATSNIDWRWKQRFNSEYSTVRLCVGVEIWLNINVHVVSISLDLLNT